jgi:hypothetical protein
MPANPMLHTRATSKAPRKQETRQNTPGAPNLQDATCFNCHKPRHYASACLEPKRTNLKEIEEEEDDESGKDDA